MKILDFLWAIIVALKPPEDGSDAKETYAWRWAVAGAIIGLTLTGLGALAWAQGRIPGVPGVATTKDVQDVSDSLNKKVEVFSRRFNRVEKTVNTINLRMVKADIQTAFGNSCVARSRGNQDALNRATEELYGVNGSPGLLEQYRDLSGAAYVMPTCEEILITPKPTK